MVKVPQSMVLTARTVGANICVYKRKELTTDEELMEEWEKQKKDFQ